MLADPLQGVAWRSQAVRALGLAGALLILIELGLNNKRDDVRTAGEAVDVARAIAGADGLSLAAFEANEGLLVSDDHDADLRAVLRSDCNLTGNHCSHKRLLAHFYACEAHTMKGEVQDALQVGDLVGCGILRSCTIFNKWQCSRR